MRRRVTLIVIFSIALLIFGVLVTLFVSTDIRYKSFRLMAEIPSRVTFLIFRKHVVYRDFEQVNTWLNREVDISKSWFSGQDVMLPGIIDNAKFAMDRVRFAEEYVQMAPYIKRLNAVYPDVFQAQLWMAELMLHSAPDQVFQYAEKATKIAASDDRPYRLAVEAALRLNQPSTAQQWCQRYTSSKAGGLHPHHYNPLFFDGQLRSLALEITSPSGDQEMIPEGGFEFGDNIPYQFALPGAQDISEMRLFVSSLPGVTLRIEKITTSLRGIDTSIDVDQVTMLSRDGFFLSPREILTTSRDGEVVTLLLPDGEFGKADIVTISLSSRRLATNNSSFCR